MLKLRFKNKKHSAVWLVEPKVSIGRASGNDLVIEDSDVAPVHAEILVKHETLTIVPTAGQKLMVNDHPVDKSLTLNTNDQLLIGKTRLEVIDPKLEQRAARPSGANGSTAWALKANNAALANRVFPIKAETVIGRSKDCDITLAAAHLSRRHVKLVVEDGLLYARDLGSANGTFLNGERLTEARVRRGDELRFDTLSFGVIGPASEDLDKTSIRPLSSVKPTVGAGQHSQSESRNVRSTHAKRPATAAAPSGSAAAEVFARNDGEASGSKSRLVWALALLLAIALGAGVIWQQGMLSS